MAVHIEGGASRDDRVERILRDPKRYFDLARRRAEAKVKREMEQERTQRSADGR